MRQGIRLSEDLGLLRVGAVVPLLRVADVDFNVAKVIEAVEKAFSSLRNP